MDHHPHAEEGTMKALVLQCHALTRKLKEKRMESSNTRDQLDTLHKNQLLEKEKWATERADITQTIAGLQENVLQKREQIVLIEKESQLFQEKIEEKQRQTQERKKIIQERSAAAAQQLAKMRVEEESGRQRLLEFRDARDVAKKKLRAALEKAELSLAEEARKHQEAIAQLQQKTKATNAQIEEEEVAWQAHLVTVERQQGLEAAALLQREKEKASEGRKEYAALLHQLKENGRQQQGLFQEIASLRSQLA